LLAVTNTAVDPSSFFTFDSLLVECSAERHGFADLGKYIKRRAEEAEAKKGDL